jgi:hypothetical protein
MCSRLSSAREPQEAQRSSCVADCVHSAYTPEASFAPLFVSACARFAACTRLGRPTPRVNVSHAARSRLSTGTRCASLTFVLPKEVSPPYIPIVLKAAHRRAVNTTGRPKPVNQTSWPTGLVALFHNQTRRPAGACAPQEERHVTSSSDKTRAAVTGARAAD